MRIIVLVDPEAIPEEDPAFEGTYEPLLTEVEYHVTEVLRLEGHAVEVMAFGPNIYRTAQAIEAYKPDLVFNLTEHYRGDRKMDAHIAAILDFLGVAYTGAGPEALILCRDKATCKRILSHQRIKIPSFTTVADGKNAPRKHLNFPIIVKPVLEDGSDGITLSSLVENQEDLVARIRYVHERMNQPVICEEFIPGREMYVAVLGNSRLTVLPPRELLFGNQEGAPAIATARVKRDEAYRKKWDIRYGDADVDPDLARRLTRISKNIYRLLKLRDYGRIDFRITTEGDVYFLEANPNPDLTQGDEVAESAVKAGISYESLVNRIARYALNRHKQL